MTLPQAHLVYSGNSLMQANGHLVYARLLNPVGDTFFRKRYESNVSFADAVAGMKAAAWDEVGMGDCYAAYANYDPQWIVQSGCIRADCSALTPDVEDEEAKYVKVDVISPFDPPGTAVYRIGWITSDTEAPDATWSWLDTATSINVTAHGRYELTTNVTLQKYVFVLLSFVSYVEPDVGDGKQYHVAQDPDTFLIPGVRFAF